jgi:hypothetical protein
VSGAGAGREVVEWLKIQEVNEWTCTVDGCGLHLISGDQIVHVTNIGEPLAQEPPDDAGEG